MTKKCISKECKEKQNHAIELTQLILKEHGYTSYDFCEIELDNPQMELDNPQNNVLNDELVNPEKRIYDIFLYGSTARGEKKPDDIDIMIIDNNTYCLNQRDIDYTMLSNALKELLQEEFLLPQEEINEIIKKVGKVDIHIISKNFFTDQKTRNYYKYNQKDPEFFKKVLQDAMVYDDRTETFIKVQDIFSYLETRYECSLDDLKTS